VDILIELDSSVGRGSYRRNRIVTGSYARDVNQVFETKIASDEALDAETEVCSLLFVARVGIEVVGSPAIELIALAEFPANDEAESNCP
jgi:hypothetical protein